MCPVCISNMAVTVIGLTSTSGLTAMVMTWRGEKKDQSHAETQEKTKKRDAKGTHA